MMIIKYDLDRKAGASQKKWKDLTSLFQLMPLICLSCILGSPSSLAAFDLSPLIELIFTSPCFSPFSAQYNKHVCKQVLYERMYCKNVFQ